MTKYSSKKVKIVLKPLEGNGVKIKIWKKRKIYLDTECKTSDEWYISCNETRFILSKLSEASKKWFNNILRLGENRE